MTDQITTRILSDVAKTGDFAGQKIAWNDMMPALITAIDNALGCFEIKEEAINDPLTGSTYTLMDLKRDVQSSLKNNFRDDPPFTIQRLAELLVSPNRYYKKDCPEKYLHALEHVINVSSKDSDFKSFSFDQEAEREQGPKGVESKNGIVLTEINWIVDTGTPPPDGLIDEGGENQKSSEVHEEQNRDQESESGPSSKKSKTASDSTSTMENSATISNNNSSESHDDATSE